MRSTGTVNPTRSRRLAPRCVGRIPTGWVLVTVVGVLLLAGCTTTAPPSSVGTPIGGSHRPTPTRSHHRPGPHGSPTATTPPAHPPKASLHPRGPVTRGWTVSDVVDGDTVHVKRGSRDLTLRLIGMDTPEVVDPFKPVECFGPAASANAHRRLDGRSVVLEFDPSQGRLDKYGRTLAYLWVVHPGHRLWLYDLAAIREGFAKEYTYDLVYRWQSRFLAAQSAARRAGRGLWSPTTCGGDTTQPAHHGSRSTPASGKCAPGYHPCLPVVADLNCSDIGHVVQVTGSDQYHLDADGNGRGCESYG
jgi:micrococcal nuclease